MSGRTATRASTRRLPLDPMQRLGAVALIVGLMLLCATWISRGAGATATGRDQISGAGTAESAVTVKWSDGLLGADNTTVVTARNRNGTVAGEDPAFAAGSYDEFKNIQVTVSQTQDLVHQAIAVTWSGARATPALRFSDYFQIMQCYGDADTGPLPEDCEFGADGLFTGASDAIGVSTRTGFECTGRPAQLGCDPLEVAPSHVVPGQANGRYTVPFVAAGTTTPLYDTPDTGLLSNYFDNYSTNEVQEAVTGADGTGTQYFQTLTATQAPGLGCGAVDTTSNKPHGCWLVIVPRGDYRTNGYQINASSGAFEYLSDSPLGASNWAQRIQIHLGFAPVQVSCPIGSAKERQTVGTQIAADAVYSWQLALNQQAKCSRLYGYTHTPEATATSQLAAGTTHGAAGLAFTTIPIGSEASRESGTQTASPVPVTYAPVAVSALTLSFNINIGSGYRTNPVKLTPRLVAKALTQSYLTDLTEFFPSNSTLSQTPTWAAHNATQLTADPEFQALNPDIPSSTGAAGLQSPLLGEDHSALNQQLWEWVLSDPTAVAWLKGTADQWGMAVNPAYSALGLGNAAADSFPRADPTCFDTHEGSVERPSVRCALNLLPYVDDYDAVAVDLRAGNDPEGAHWDPSKTAADGSPGDWGTGTLEGSGATFMWGVTDSPSSATFGLVAAALCDSAGQNCVSPTVTSVSAALATAKADTAGVLAVEPAAVPAGAYPLVDVTYAAVRTDDDPAAIGDYADLISFAAGQGQTAGEAPGDLPPGYLPLTDKLKSAATTVVNSLRAIASGATTSTTATTTASTAIDNSGNSTDTGGGQGTDGQGTSGAEAATVSQSGGETSAGPVSVVKPTSTPVVYSTPAQPAPTARFATIGIVLGGVVGLVGGPLTRIIGRRRATGMRR